MKSFKLIPTESIFGAGVCSGIAYRFGISVLAVRLLVVLSCSFSSGLTLFLYVMTAILSEKYDKTPSDYAEICDRAL